MDPYYAELTVLIAGAPDVTPAMWERAARAIARRNGKLVQLRTGTLIAVFEAGYSKCAEAAVWAALELRDELRSQYGFSITVCLATGVVTVDSITAEGRLEISGDPLDLATRLLSERARQGGGIFLAGDVSTEIELNFRIDDLSARAVGLKGKAALVQVYEVTGTASSAMPPIPPGVRQHLVSGRPAASSLHMVYGSMLEAMQRPASRPAAFPVSDWVVSTVFAPPTVAIGAPFLVQVFAHLSDGAEEAASLATEFDAAATRRVFRSLETEIARGTRLTFELTMRGAEVDDPVARLVWNGRTEGVQFGVTVPRTAPAGALIGMVTVSQDSVPVGHFKFKLQVVEGPATGQASEPVGDSARRYTMAFISYASQDRDKVLSRVQMLRPLGIRYFQDILDLEPGARWERELYRHIDECDLFLLFWSRSAKESKWVLEEAKYALARKGEDEFAPPEIMPIILEGPPILPPPPELARLHFNDRLIYFMSGPPA